MMKKTTKTLVPLVLAFFAGTSLTAQDCEAYFPMNEGAVRVMEMYNAKDKPEGKVTYTVDDITTEGGITYIGVDMLMEDKKGKEVFNSEMVMECEDGVFRVDMKNYMAGMMAGMGDMEAEIDSKNLEFPTNLSVGMELPDGYINTSMSSGGMSIMSMKVEVVNRKVEAMETITTPAGTFDCFKVSQDSKVKSVMSMTTSSVEWIAKDVGVVRSESYNKKGDLESYAVLTSFKN
jgi:hypothetical protein